MTTARATLTPHQEAALNYANHISLTANAGSGKTFILSKRYLEIALNENVPLRNIAAITFTDKAASELYTKIVNQINDRADTEQNIEVLHKLERIRRQLVSASISTIHAFCMDILREFPVEAGLDANFSAIDERESDELIEICVEELIKKTLVDEDSDKLKYLIRVFASKSIFVRELTSLIKNRKNVSLLFEKLYIKNEHEIAEQFYNSFLLLLDKLLFKDYSSFERTLNEINEIVLEADKKNEIAVEIKSLLNKIKIEKKNESKLILLIQLTGVVATQSYTVKKKGYLSSKLAEGLDEKVKFINSYLKTISKCSVSTDHSEIEFELAKFGKIISSFFLKALDLYTNRKNESGFLDYEDILLLTQNILGLENVRISLGEKYKYIMVDEYQDTNEIQYNIFLPILDHLKKGNLFVVGDEKQSIYRFRDAELEVFNRTQKDIQKTSGEKYLLSLPDSFRMAPAVCLFVNYIFKNLFASPEEYYNEVKHTDLVCARDENPFGKVEILISPKQKRNRQSALFYKDKSEENQSEEESEADLVAKKILLLVNATSEEGKNICSDIAVLVRKRKHFADLEKVFVKYNIPFLIVGGKGFYQRQVIYDIYNYFSFLLNQENDASLLGILRSPFFLVPDTKIFEISLMKGISYWEKLNQYINKSDELKQVVKKLNENILYSRSYDFTAMLQKILVDSEFLPVVNSASAGEQELANLDKLVKLTMNFAAQGFNTLYDYVDYLGDSLDSIEDESQAAITDDSASVKIMTLHQAKGLEFPVVILYKCETTPMIDAVKAKSITINKEFGLLTKVPLNENYSGEYKAAPLLAMTDLLNMRRESAELKRLFYVGATRAKEHLILSCSANEENTFPEDSFMSMLVNGLNADLSGDSISINSDLSFLLKSETGYLNRTKELKLEIPITRYIEQTIPLKSSEQTLQIEPVFDTKTILDLPEGEIISATKFSVFSQCQVKYELIYETGYSDIAKHFKTWRKNKNVMNDPIIELNEKEDLVQKKVGEENPQSNSINTAALRGRIIHKFLQSELRSNEIDLFLKSEIKNGLTQSKSENIDNTLLEGIKSDLENYLNSEVYKRIKSFKNFKNEFEVYVKENDFYLYGIIDKLIIENNTIEIVDYKTDNIPIDKIVPKSEHYLNQLKFYSYIVSRLFKEVSEIFIHLIFIKHPQSEIFLRINKDEIKKIKEQISDFVNITRKSIYEKNLTHCTSCNFSLVNSRCVKNQD